MKNLTPDELAELHKCQGRASGKHIMPWVERLSAARGDLNSLQKTFDRFEQDKDVEIARLNRQLQEAYDSIDQLKTEADFYRIEAERKNECPL